MRPVWHVMWYLVLFMQFMQISLRRSDFQSTEIYYELKTFVLQYFCNFNSPNLHLPIGQVKHRIHKPDRKIH